MADGLLERLEAIEDEQGALLLHEPGEAGAFAGEVGVGVAEPLERHLEEVADVAGAGAGAVGEIAGALVVERPVEIGEWVGPAGVVFPVFFDEAGAHPFDEERGFAYAAPGDEAEDMEAAGPGAVEQGEFGVAPEEKLGVVVEEFGRVDALGLAGVLQLDDIAPVKAGREGAVVDADGDDAPPLRAGELDFLVHPLRLHRRAREDDDKGIALADAALDARPEFLVGLDGVAVVEDLSEAEAAHELDKLGDVAVVRAAVGDEGAFGGRRIWGAHDAGFYRAGGGGASNGNEWLARTDCRANVAGAFGAGC